MIPWSLLSNNLTNLFIFVTIKIILHSNLSILEGNIQQSIILYGLMSIVTYFIDAYFSVLYDRMGDVVSLDYEKKQWVKYSKLDFKSKNADTVDSFREKLCEATRVIHNMYGWMISTIVNMISSVISLVYTIYAKDQIALGITIFIINLSWYFILCKPISDKLAKMRKDNRTTSTRIHRLMALDINKLHANNGNADDIIGHRRELYSNNSHIKYYSRIVHQLTLLPNYITFILIGLYVDQSLWIVFYILVNNFNNTMSNASHFYNQMRTNGGDIGAVDEFFKDKTYEIEFEQLDLPASISITQNNDNIFNLTNDIVILKGPSGSGKTTHFHGILGFKPGMLINGINPAHYRNSVEFLPQDSLKTTPTELSLQELFKSVNITRIEKCLQIVCLGEWYKMIGSIYNPIKNRCSGGERNRIALAITICNCLERKLPLLILDEPDRGLNADLAITVLNNIIDALPGVKIMMATHLCDCQLRNIKSTQIVNVNVEHRRLN